MPRYVVERTFPEGLGIPASPKGAAACRAVVERNLEGAVTWLHSYVSADEKTTFCVYEADSPQAIRDHASAAGLPVDEAIRDVAERNGLPVDRITQVRVLDPYFNG